MVQSKSQKAEIPTASEAPVLSDSFVDESVERILRAAGSSLRHYMPSSKDALRKAMREVLAATHEAGQ